MLDTFEFAGALRQESIAGHVPNLSDYFDCWSMHEPVLRALVDQFNGMNLQMHVQSAEAKNAVRTRDRNQRNFDITDDGIAQFWVSGPMMKSVSSMSDGTSTVRLRRQIQLAARDESVRGAIIAMDTPGGTVKGNRDLADDIAKFNQRKPIFAYVEDMTASAGVSIASQTRRINANNSTAMYGAMGTYSVLYDASGHAEKLGINVHVVKAGEFKGMGEPGTVITKEQLAEVQRTVDALNQSYIEMIASGRKMSVEQITKLANGSIYMASEALKFGLIDGIATYEETYQQLLEEIGPTAGARSVSQALTNDEGNQNQTESGKEGATMADKTAATLAELKQTFPNSTADWRETQLEAGSSLTESAIAYAAFVEAKAKEDKEAHQKELDDAKAKAAASSNGGLGGSPLTAQGMGDGEFSEQTGNAREDFNAAVGKIAGENPGRKQRMDAIRVVAKRKPELYQAFLVSTNSQSKKVQRQIVEKMEDTVS